MTLEKRGRAANAIGFLAGVLACLTAVRDTKILWPPSELWQQLNSTQHLELGGGIALIVIVIVSAIFRGRPYGR